jgi:hypothetical protein
LEPSTDFKQISAHAWREEITILVISGTAKSDTPRRKRLYFGDIGKAAESHV